MIMRVLILVSALVLTGCATARQMVRFQDPLSSDEHLALGLSYEKQTLWPDAEREYRAAVRRDKKKVTARIALGNLLFARQRYAEAEPQLRAALKFAPHNAAVNNNLAMVYLARDKKLRQAERLARRAADDPRFKPYALDTLARIYARQNRMKEAEASMIEARALAPDDSIFHKHLDETNQLISERRHAEQDVNFQRPAQ